MIAYVVKELVGALEFVDVFGQMCVCADDDGNAEGIHIADGLARGIVVVVATLVDATGVYLADASFLGEEVESLVEQVAVPRLVIAEESSLVVHRHLVDMSYDGGGVPLYHGVVLVEECLYRQAYVAAKETLQTFVVRFGLASVDIPEVVKNVVGTFAECLLVSGRGDKVHAADAVFQTSLIDEGREVLLHAGNIVYLKSQPYVDAVVVFVFQTADGVAVFCVLLFLDGVFVRVGQRAVSGESQCRESSGDGVFHIFTWFAFAVAVAAVGVVIGFQE